MATRRTRPTQKSRPPTNNETLNNNNESLKK